MILSRDWNLQLVDPTMQYVQCMKKVHRTTDLDVLEWHIELERVSWCACVSECVMHSCRACLSWGMSLMCLWQDGRSKNRFSRPKEPIASPPPVKSDKVMRADGAWFYLTSEPPEAGTWIASNRNRLCAVMPVLYMLMSGGGLRQGGQYIYTEYVYNYIYIYIYRHIICISIYIYIHIIMYVYNPRGNLHSRTGEPVHSLNDFFNVLEF